MTGVEILSMSPIVTWPLWTLIIAVVATIMIGIILGILCKDPAIGFGGAIVTFLICAFIFAVGGVGSYETGKYEYKVIIDDSVSMNEFLDKYEIIDQEGKIYTVKEREN